MSGIDRQHQCNDFKYPRSMISLKNRADELPEFREYVCRKYNVDLEEDLIIMIEDLIERQRQRLEI